MRKWKIIKKLKDEAESCSPRFTGIDLKLPIIVLKK